MLFLTLFGCSIIGIEDGWQHGNVTQIKDFFTSTFLITPDDGSIVLIDSGFNKNAKPIVNKLADMGKTPEDVSMIFFTHGHTDHVNGTPIFPNAEIHAIAQEEEELAESDISIEVFINDRDVIDIGDSKIEVFWMPGHTAGNAAFLVDDVLVFGDCAQGLKDETLTPVDEGYSDDPEQAAKAIEKLAEIFKQRESDISWLAFSHTGPLKGVQALLDYTVSE